MNVLMGPGDISAAFLLLFTLSLPASGQISFKSAVTLALQNSSRVKMAQDDFNRSVATLAESKSVFIPSLGASFGAGGSYGITTTVPTIFTINAQSLTFNFSQLNYIRSSRAGVDAAGASLEDAREQIEEDVAITYFSLERDQQKQAATAQEYGHALKLVSIVQDRLDAGMETALEVKQALRISVRIRLQQLQLEDEIASLSDHLAYLIGLPAEHLTTVPGSLPPDPGSFSSAMTQPGALTEASAVLSAEANARAKREQAIGDSHYLWRPQIAFSAQYGRISPINNVATYYNLGHPPNYNTAFAGVSIQLPLFDKTHEAKARESAAEAQHAEHTVALLRDQLRETRKKLQHAIAELATKAELAALDQGIAQDQLSAALVQINMGSGRDLAPPMTPKDEQKARIEERQRYTEMLDATFQLREEQIYLLRQTGQLQNWINSAESGTASTRALK